MQKHRDHVEDIDAALVPYDLMEGARGAWEDALGIGKDAGFRNAQATVLAPTGTIGFMMDCDTTGVEPDIALVKYKKLVGGGMMKIVNTTMQAILNAGVVAQGAGAAAGPARRRLPDERRALTHKFDISGHEGYLTV